MTPQEMREKVRAAVEAAQGAGLELVAELGYTHPKDGKVCLGGAMALAAGCGNFEVSHNNEWGKGMEAMYTAKWAFVVSGFQNMEVWRPSQEENEYVQIGKDFRPSE